MISSKIIDHLYIFLSLFLGVYSQLIMRWQVSMAGTLPDTVQGKVLFIGHLFLNPWVISGFFATLLGGITWMMVMTKFEINYAYPWMALNYVLVIGFSALFLSESLNMYKIIGSLFIILGIIIISRGQ